MIRLLMLLCVLTLSACGVQQVKEPPPVDVVVVAPIVCDQAPQIDKIQIKDLEFRPVWGIDIAPMRDVTAVPELEKPPSIQAVAPGTYKLPVEATPAVWVALSPEMYGTLALNTAEMLKQSKQLLAVKEYLVDCITRYNTELAKKTRVDPAAANTDGTTTDSSGGVKANGTPDGGKDDKSDTSCRNHFFQFWRRRCDSS